jgi:hypothetical protein
MPIPQYEPCRLYGHCAFADIPDGGDDQLIVKRTVFEVNGVAVMVKEDLYPPPFPIVLVNLIQAEDC